MDIVRLETHVGWLAKGLLGLGTVSAIVLGWLIINLYTPMHDIAKDVAVQTAVMGDLKEQVGDIKDRLDDIGDQPAQSPRKR